MDFIQKHPCRTTAILGTLAILLSFFIEQLAAYGLGVFLFFLLVVRLVGVILVGINIAAMLLVTNDKPVAGVILSLPFGGLGAVIGLMFNQSCEYETAVKIIFSIQLWVLIWGFVSFMLYTLNYYSSGGFAP